MDRKIDHRQIVEHDFLPEGRGMKLALLLTMTDASGAVTHEIGQLIHQGKVADVVHQKLRSTPYRVLQCRWVANPRIGNDCIPMEN